MLTVHKDSIILRGKKVLVVVPEDGKAAFRHVVLGDEVGNRFIVKNGLREAELVITRGNERLRPKQLIQFNVK